MPSRSASTMHASPGAIAQAAAARSTFVNHVPHEKHLKPTRPRLVSVCSASELAQATQA